MLIMVYVTAPLGCEVQPMQSGLPSPVDTCIKGFTFWILDEELCWFGAWDGGHFVGPQ